MLVLQAKGDLHHPTLQKGQRRRCATGQGADEKTCFRDHGLTRQERGPELRELRRHPGVVLIAPIEKRDPWPGVKEHTLLTGHNHRGPLAVWRGPQVLRHSRRDPVRPPKRRRPLTSPPASDTLLRPP